MKQIKLTIVLTLLTCLSIFGQKLTLTDLINLCSKKNWEDVNQILLSKGWTYYDSEKGNTYKYNTITWSFNKNYYADKAQAWFHIYTYEGLPNKISYSVFNKESYSIIQNSISSAGFKLTNSEIEDNEIVSTYSNTNYTLQLSTEKREQSEDYRASRSFTAYEIVLIRKAGVYDPDNGKKTDYYYGDVVKAEYALTNGKINGPLKVYHYNGKIKKTGNYSNGIENGLFKEYDENGNLEAEYSMTTGELNGEFKTYYPNRKLKKSGKYLKGNEHGHFVEYDEYGIKNAEYEMANGMKNGLMNIYEDGKIVVTIAYKDDNRNGQRIEYYYNDETGDLQLKQIEEYSNDEKNGTWKLLFIEDGKERLLKFENYTKGVLNGAFQDINGDSLIIGSYKNDELHGEYRVYRDLMKTIFGGVIQTDTSVITLISEGSYYEGLESGHWKNYGLSGTLTSEGRFSNGHKSGEWNYYYTSLIDENGGNMPYSRQLYLVQNFSNGKLDGKSTRFSYLEELKFPCSEIDNNKSSLDTCRKYVYQKVSETKYYKNDKLNGPYELRDSINEIIAKGFFKDDLKDGEWFHRYVEKDINDETYFIYQKGNYNKDKRDGKWIQYYTEGNISKTFNYWNGELHGEYTEWNNLNKPREIKHFLNGKLTELVIYDSLGTKPNRRYEIYNEQYNNYKCRKTEYYTDNTSTSQEYWLKKEKEIDHNWFELIFTLSVGEFSDGTMGYKDGVFKLLNPENQPLIKGKYYKEDRVGLWTFFFYDQKVKVESNFTKNNKIDEKYFSINGNLFTGEFIYNDEENGIREERKIKDGLRNGKTVYIDKKTKKVIKRERYKNGELK